MVTSVHKLVVKLFLVFMAICSLNSAQAANIVAFVDRNPVSLDESFKLVFESDAAVDGDPDFSMLERDFEILNTSQSTSMNFVNGVMSHKRTWTLILISKRAGTITIPSISFGKDSSPALRVTVNNVSPNNNKANAEKDIYLEVEVDRSRTWVQAQIVYTVRLFHRVNIASPTLTPLETSDKDAIIERLGDARNYEAFRSGVRYAVSELSFAIYPQHSGELTFNPVFLEGRVGTSRTHSLFDQFFGGGQVTRVRSKSLTVDVLPRPDQIPLSNWLPAEQLSLEQSWSENIQQLKSGEPVTRTITISTKGQMASLLPDPALPDIKGIKQYPDKPVLKDTPSKTGMTGMRQVKIAMIPTGTGKLTLPAISLPWWNTKTGNQETATLPAVTLNVIAGAAGSSPALPVVTQPATSAQNPAIEQPVLAAGSSDESALAPFWPWLSAILAIGWLITLVAYLRKRPATTTPAREPVQPDTATVKALAQAVLKQCQQHKATDTKNALLEWANAHWPEKNLNSLGEIARHGTPELRDAIMALNSVLYSGSGHSWDGTPLKNAFSDFLKKGSEKKDSNQAGLEPLYKI